LVIRYQKDIKFGHKIPKRFPASIKTLQKRQPLTIQQRVSWVIHIHLLHILQPVDLWVGLSSSFALHDCRVSDFNDPGGWRLDDDGESWWSFVACDDENELYI
jgi:hypothetical protein